MKGYLFIAALILTITVSAQQKLDTFHVYFALNDTALDEKAVTELSSLSLKKGVTNNDTLLIVGYADMLGKDQLNNKLSTMRAQHVKAYMLSNGAQITTIKLCIGKGAVKRDTVLSKEGFPTDRRVDIIAPRGIIIKKRVPVFVQKGKTFNTDTFERAKKNDLFVLSKVYFIVNRHTYDTTSEKELETLYNVLAKHTSIRIRIEGHVCCTPPNHDAEDWDVPKELTREDMRKEENTLPRYMLSENRAWKIRNYLVKKGINPERIHYAGFGGNRPAYKEDTQEGRTKNMRVEIRITQQ